MGYQVKGRLLEVCTCRTLCPCWVGDDPDGGTCDGCLAWRIDAGAINGVDVSGRTMVALVHIPGREIGRRCCMWTMDRHPSSKKRC